MVFVVSRCCNAAKHSFTVCMQAPSQMDIVLNVFAAQVEQCHMEEYGSIGNIHDIFVTVDDYVQPVPHFLTGPQADTCGAQVLRYKLGAADTRWWLQPPRGHIRLCRFVSITSLIPVTLRLAQAQGWHSSPSEH